MLATRLRGRDDLLRLRIFFFWRRLLRGDCRLLACHEGIAEFDRELKLQLRARLLELQRERDIDLLGFRDTLALLPTRQLRLATAAPLARACNRSASVSPSTSSRIRNGEPFPSSSPSIAAM